MILEVLQCSNELSEQTKKKVKPPCLLFRCEPCLRLYFNSHPFSLTCNSTLLVLQSSIESHLSKKSPLLTAPSFMAVIFERQNPSWANFPNCFSWFRCCSWVRDLFIFCCYNTIPEMVYVGSYSGAWQTREHGANSCSPSGEGPVLLYEGMHGGGTWNQSQSKRSLRQPGLLVKKTCSHSQ